MGEPAPLPVPHRSLTQRTTSDCGVTSLAVLLGLPYERVLLVYSRLFGRKKVAARGMSSSELVAVAAELGYRLAPVSAGKYEPREAHGLAFVRFTDPTTITRHGNLRTWAHVLVVREGWVYETDGTVRTVDEWLAACAPVMAKLRGMLRLVGRISLAP